MLLGVRFGVKEPLGPRSLEICRFDSVRVHRYNRRLCGRGWGSSRDLRQPYKTLSKGLGSFCGRVDRVLLALIVRAAVLLNEARRPADGSMYSWLRRRHTLEVRVGGVAHGEVELGRRTAEVWAVEAVRLLREAQYGLADHQQIVAWGCERRAVTEAIETLTTWCSAARRR